MSLAESTYRVSVTKDQWFDLSRWSFFQREQGWGLFSDIYNAFKNEQETRGRVLQFQLVSMTLGHQDQRQTEMFIVEQAKNIKDKGEIEAQTQVFRATVQAIYDAEYKDYLRSMGVDPDKADENGENPPEAKTKGKGTSSPAT